MILRPYLTREQAKQAGWTEAQIRGYEAWAERNRQAVYLKFHFHDDGNVKKVELIDNGKTTKPRTN